MRDDRLHFSSYRKNFSPELLLVCVKVCNYREVA